MQGFFLYQQKLLDGAMTETARLILDELVFVSAAILAAFIIALYKNRRKLKFSLNRVFLVIRDASAYLVMLGVLVFVLNYCVRVPYQLFSQSNSQISKLEKSLIVVQDQLKPKLRISLGPHPMSLHVSGGAVGIDTEFAKSLALAHKNKRLVLPWIISVENVGPEKLEGVFVRVLRIGTVAPQNVMLLPNLDANKATRFSLAIEQSARLLLFSTCKGDNCEAEGKGIDIGGDKTLHFTLSPGPSEFNIIARSDNSFPCGKSFIVSISADYKLGSVKEARDGSGCD